MLLYTASAVTASASVVVEFRSFICIADHFFVAVLVSVLRYLLLMRCFDEPGRTSLLQGMLRERVERDSCCWAIEKKPMGRETQLVVQLQKQQSVHWESLFQVSVAVAVAVAVPLLCSSIV